MTREIYIVGNWKMNQKISDIESFFNAINPVLSKLFSFLHDKQVITNDLNLKMGLFLLKEKLKNVPINPEI